MINGLFKVLVKLVRSCYTSLMAQDQKHSMTPITNIFLRRLTNFLLIISILLFIWANLRWLVRQRSSYLLGVPMVYEEELDFRVIVMTHNRHVSVMKLLNSLNTLHLNGDRAALEIWIDPNKQGQVDNDTLRAVSNFSWSKGPSRVHVHTTHVGILGQWIDTWRPFKAPPFVPYYNIDPVPFKHSSYHEIALFLEDDMTVSPYAYRWLKAAHRKYGGRSDFAGATLYSDNVRAHNSQAGLHGPKNHSIYMYACVGSWGFSPSSHYWAYFQNWYHEKRNTQNLTKFQPLVANIRPTSWYSEFLRSKKQDGMWTMWYIYFAYMRDLYTVYSNLQHVTGNRNSSLAINRQEAGLHYGKGIKGMEKILMKKWDNMYEDLMPDEPVKLGWNGEVVG